MAGRPAKSLPHRVTEYCSDFGIDMASWRKIAQDISGWYWVVEGGAKMYAETSTTTQVNATNARHVKEISPVPPLVFILCLPKVAETQQVANHLKTLLVFSVGTCGCRLTFP